MTTLSDTASLFDRAVEHLFGVEGGYVFDPHDRGGETKYGISKRQHPQLNIATLTLEQATEIYRQNYWLRYDCDKLPPAFGVLLFDGVVNHKAKTAVRLLQMALRVTADGYLGPRTIGAANSASRLSSYPEIISLAFAYRADFYHDLIVANSSQERFSLGWFKRLFMLQQFIEKEIR